MKNLRNKLILCFSVLLAFLAVVGVIGYRSLAVYGTEVRRLIEEDFARLQIFNQLSQGITEQVAVARAYLLYSDNNTFYDMFRSLSQRMAELEQQLLQDKQAASVHDLLRTSSQWRTSVEERIFSQISRGDLQSAAANATALSSLSNEIVNGLSNAVLAEQQKMKEREAELAALRSQSISLIVLFTIAACFLGFLLALFLSKAIALPVVDVSKRLEQLAVGDLTGQELAVRSKDEVGRLVTSLNHVVRNLREMISAVEERAEQLASHSEELSASAEENGASVSEVAATATEFASTVENIADHSKEMDASAKQISAMVVSGEESLAAALKNTHELQRELEGLSSIINGLGSRSNEIGNIVNVIKAIAEQINLLALNAAIEAARAGEHGRGFAVVAEEVRKLAEQSSQATAEITELIRGVQAETEAAVKAMNHDRQLMEVTASVVKNAGDSVHEIIRHIQQITQHIAEVNEGIGFIRSASQEIAASTEEQSATIEQAASSAQNLAVMAGDLQGLVERFKLA